MTSTQTKEQFNITQIRDQGHFGKIQKLGLSHSRTIISSIFLPPPLTTLWVFACAVILSLSPKLHQTMTMKQVCFESVIYNYYTISLLCMGHVRLLLELVIKFHLNIIFKV